MLRWFQDRTVSGLPRGWVLSVPMIVYRGAMLAWSLWLALALLGWLRWAWTAFTTGGAWKRSHPPLPAPKSADSDWARPTSTTHRERKRRNAQAANVERRTGTQTEPPTPT